MANTDTNTATAMLRAEHREVERLFAAFSSCGDANERFELARLACNALAIHTRLEEEIFYPAAQELAGPAGNVEEARMAHQLANELIAELKATLPDDPQLSPRFHALGEAVKAHIAEEEATLFPRMDNAGIDGTALHEALQARRAALRIEIEGQGEDA